MPQHAPNAPDWLVTALNDTPELTKDVRSELELVWQISEKADASPAFDRPDVAMNMWANIEKQTTNLQDPVQLSTSQILPFKSKRWIWAVAASLVLLATSVLFYSYNQNQTPEKQYYTAGIGDLRQEKLPDGSLVQLNSGSEVQYEQSKQGRHAILKGEAFFDIVKNGEPFVVETFNANIRVLGTRFSVRTLNNRTEVVLASGKVALAGKQDTLAMLMLPGQRAEVVSGKVQDPQETDIDTALGWKEGGLAMIHTTVEDIATHLARLYGQEIRVNNQRIKNIEITLHYAKKPVLETILKDLCVSVNCSIEPNRKGFILQ